MTREQKSIVVAELTEKLNENQFFYIQIAPLYQ